MDFFINGKKIDITLENENTVQKILLGIENWCAGNELIINKIIVNGEKVFYSAEDENILGDAKDIGKIEIEAVTYFEYAFNSFIGIVEYINSISECEIEEKNIMEITDGIEFIIESIPRTTFLLNISLDKYSILEQMKMLEARCERMKELESSPYEAINFFKNEVQSFIKEKFIGALTLILEDIQTNLLISFTHNITSENILYRVGSLKSFTEPLTDILEQMVSCLQTGNDKNAFALVEKFSKSIESIFHIMSKALYLYNIKIEDIEYEGVSLLAFTDNINANMKNILSAFENEDYVSIADIFEYEIKEQIPVLTIYIELIEKTIENKLAAL